MREKIDYTLYLVTDRNLIKNISMKETIISAIEGGCTVVQLREKTASSRDFFEYAKEIKGITDCYNIPLIINDRVDIAMAIDASGVHVGQSDIPVEIIRKMIGPKKIVGASVSNLDEAILAVSEGADYLGIGAMFSTSTKEDATIVTFEQLKEIRKNIYLPIVVIGGINKNTIPKFYGIGVDGVAVVSAIIGQDNPKEATINIKNLIS